MLKLLRKYQKGIFAVVAVMVIASFSFFGTYGAIRPEKSQDEDKVIGKTVDGAPLSSKDVAFVERFIDTDFQDLMSGGGERSINLLNDGFIRNDIIGAGLGAKVWESYKDELQPEIVKKIRTFKAFTPYVHPSRKMSFEEVVKQFAPSYYADLVAFRAEGGGVPELMKLYADQLQFPGEMVRRMMLYRDYQQGGGDSGLRHADLSLFYAKSLTDWFGKSFVEKMARLVCQGAAFAKQKGYKVSFKEAKSSLLQIAMTHYQELNSEKTPSNEEFGKFYRGQIAALQMNEADVVKTWQKILVFRKMLEEIGHSVTVDATLYKQFAEFASKGAKVELYRLPEALQLKSQDEAMQLEGYLDLVAKRRADALLPEEFYSVEEMQSRAPDLVERRFLVKVASIKKGDLAKEISLKRTWAWELQERNWNQLKGEFSELAKCKSVNEEERFAFLEGLDFKVREKIDLFAQKKILELEPDFLKEKLTRMEPKLREISVSLVGDKEIVPGVTDGKAFLELLDTGSHRLACYTENGEDFVAVMVVDASPRAEVLTFAEAKKRGLLDGHKKEIKEVDVSRRLVPFMKKMEQGVILGKEGLIAEKPFTTASETLSPKPALDKQWGLQREEVTVTRKMSHPLFDEKLFSMKEGEWSDVKSTEKGPVFYRVVETFVDTSVVAEKLAEGRNLLGAEAKQNFFKTLLSEIKTADGS